MGLDLYLYKKDEWDRFDKEYREAEAYALEHNWEWPAYYQPKEICYGRKTWSIYNFFRNRGEYIDEALTLIDKDAIEDFIEVVKPFIESISVYNNYNKIAEYFEGDFDMLAKERFENDIEIAQFISKWVDNGGDNDFQLGQDWEMMAIEKWFNILSAFDIKDDDEFIMDASY